MLKELVAHDLLKNSPVEMHKYVSLLERPKNGQADLAIPCFTLGEGSENPALTAIRICGEFARHLPKADMSVQAEGPYVNITLSSKYLANHLRPPTRGSANGKIIVLDYSSPNIGKPFGIGHLRSTVIGASIKAIFEYRGWKVIGINHLGDWGTQYGNLIAAYRRWGSEYDFSDHVVEDLYALYVKFHQEIKSHPELEEEGREWFAKLEAGDSQARSLWNSFREKSLAEFNALYQVMGIHFDHVLGESFYGDKMQSALEAMQEKGILTEDQGALIVDFKLHGLADIPPAIIVKTNKSSTYILRDVASLLYRYRTFHFDLALYEVGAEQALHFKQVFAIGKLLGYELNCEHISHGLYMFPEGKMSTRKGNIIFIEDVIKQTEEKVAGIIAEKNPGLDNKAEVARTVALGAIIFQDLRQDRVKTVTFSWEKMLDFDGETGPYVQYGYARICSILRKIPHKPPAKVHELRTEHELLVAKQLLQFDDAVEQAMQQRKPHILCRYVLDLVQLFSAFYAAHRVLHDEERTRADRLALAGLVAATVKQSCQLLGIPLTDEM